MQNSKQRVPSYIRAIQYAAMKHGEIGQRRKWSDAPYIVHPIAVAKFLIRHTNPTDAMLIAAVLHDTVEDTNTTLDDIKVLFGADVAELVYWLTDVAVPSDGNRAVRMEINRKHIAGAPGDAQTIKAADIIDNIKNIVDAAPGFARKYLKEKRAVYHSLERADSGMLVLLDAALTIQENKLVDISPRRHYN